MHWSFSVYVCVSLCECVCCRIKLYIFNKYKRKSAQRKWKTTTHYFVTLLRPHTESALFAALLCASFLSPQRLSTRSCRPHTEKRRLSMVSWSLHRQLQAHIVQRCRQEAQQEFFSSNRWATNSSRWTTSRNIQTSTFLCGLTVIVTRCVWFIPNLKTTAKTTARFALPVRAF